MMAKETYSLALLDQRPQRLVLGLPRADLLPARTPLLTLHALQLLPVLPLALLVLAVSRALLGRGEFGRGDEGGGRGRVEDLLRSEKGRRARGRWEGRLERDGRQVRDGLDLRLGLFRREKVNCCVSMSPSERAGQRKRNEERTCLGVKLALESESSL